MKVNSPVTVTGDHNETQVTNKIKLTKKSKIGTTIGAVVIVAIVVVVALSGGGSGGGSGSPSALIGGVWLLEDGGRAPHDFPEEIEFFSDGTCICEGIYGDVNHGSFSVNGNRLKITIVWDALTYDFVVKGNTLSLSDGDETVIYKRTR